MANKKPWGSNNFFTNLLARIYADPTARLIESVNTSARDLLGKPQKAITENILGSKVVGDIKKDPLIQGTGKGALGEAVAALTLPGLPAMGGGAVLSKAGPVVRTLAQGARGAIEAGAAGYSGSDKGNEKSNTITSAALGSILGLGTGVINEVKNAASKSVWHGVNTKTTGGAKKNGLAADQLEQAKNDIENIYRNITGEKAVTSKGIVNRQGDIIKSLDERVGQAAAESNPLLDTGKKIRDVWNNKIPEAVKDTLSKYPEFEKFNAVLNAMDDSPLAQDARALLQATDDLAGGLKGVQEPGANASKRWLSYIRNTVRDDISQYAKPLSKALNEYSSNLKVLGALKDNVDKRLGFMTKGVSLDLKGTLEKIGNGSRGKGDLLSILAGQVGNLNRGESQPSTNVTPSQSEGIIGSGSTANDSMYQLSLPGSQNSFIDSLAMASQIAPGATAVQQLQLAQALFDSKTSQGKSLTTGALQDLSSTKEALGLLPDLDSLIKESGNAFGPVEGQLRGANPFDKTGQKAKSTITLIKQIIGKGLEGGVLRKEDEYKYEQILPKLGDTEDTVKTKIALLKKTLTNKYKTQIETYQSGGYDPFKGSSSEADALQQILGQQ